MEQNKKIHIRVLKEAKMFIIDDLSFDLALVKKDFILEKLILAKKHLKDVQIATLELEEINSEEFESTHKNDSDCIRKTLSQFINDSEYKLKDHQETSEKEKTNTLVSSSKDKEIRQEPRIFGKTLVGKKYKIGSILPCENSGWNLDVPIREFKSFALDTPVPIEKIETSFVDKLGKFAGACMNARFNGTIYFGVADEKGDRVHKHGEIIGVNIEYSEIVQYEEWIEKHFKGKDPKCLKTCSSKEKIAFSTCISPLHVIQLDDSSRVVLEIDIEPSFNITKYLNFKVNFPNNPKNGIYFLRNASSSFKITEKKEIEEFLKVKLQQSIRFRQELENDRKEMPADNNIKLLRLLCKGEPRIFYNKYHYFLMINSICQKPCCKMKGIQDLDWISSIEWRAIFDFNPNTEENSVLKLLNDCKDVLDKPSEITTEQVESLFDMDLNGHSFLKSYKQKVFHITCCKKEAKSQYLFTDWKGHFLPNLRKIFDFLTGPSRIPTPNDIAIIVLCCSNEKEKEFLAFLTEISMKYDILKQFSFLSQNASHLKAITNSIIEAYDNESETRKLPALLRQNSLCLQWNLIDSFVKQNTLDITNEDKCIQTTSGIPIPVKPKVVEKFNSVGIFLLGSNECKELRKMPSEEIKDMYNNTMKDFLRGKDPSWELYYFVYNKLDIGKVVPEALIERDMVKDIQKKIEVLKNSEEKCIELVGIGHLPGTGASTIAMNVLWLLKDKFRCLKIDGKGLETANLENLSLYLLELRSFGEDKKLVKGEEVLECLPLLILIDDTDHETAKDFQRKIQNEVLSKKITFRKTLGIIFFVHNNKLEQSNLYSSFNLSEKFSASEREKFLRKLEQFESGIDSEQFQPDQLQIEDMIGFLIMMSYFDTITAKQNEYKNRIYRIVSKIGYALDGYPNEKWLLLVLAIFKFYGDSNISLSHASIILGYGEYKKLIEDVCDHFKMLVRTKVVFDEFGDHEVVEMTHCQVAEVLLKRFLESEEKSVIDVFQELFENKSLMNHLFLRRKLLKDLRVIVVRRKWRYINDGKIKEEGKKERERFSPLILELKNKNPDSAVKLLQKVINRFESLNLYPIDTGSAVIHQTLSRLYLSIDKLDQAKECARCAIKINDVNFRYYDTLGQVYKKEVTDYCKTEDNKKIIMNDLFRSASEAIKNFRKAQDLFEHQNSNFKAEMSSIEDDCNDIELFIPAIFQGYFGEITVNLCIADKVMGLAEQKEQDQVRSFISGKKGNLKHLADRHNIDLSKYAVLLSEIHNRTISCMKAIMQKLDSRIIQNYETHAQLRRECEKYSKIFSTNYFKKLPGVMLNTKTPFQSKLNQLKNYFDINLIEYLYHVRNLDSKQSLLLHETIQALKNHFDLEKRDLKSLDIFYLVCLLNANLALSIERPIFEFKDACSLSKHLTSVDSEKYENYFWYTVLNWPTEKERMKNSLAVTYDEALLEKCVKKLQGIYYSSLIPIRKEKHFLIHNPFYMMHNEIGYKKIYNHSNNERISGKILDEHSVEYCLPRGTKLRIRCAHLRINRGSLTENVTFEVGFTLAGPVAYKCKENVELKSYNDDAVG